MKLSVIIVTWNSRADIDKCLDSVYAQAIADIEVIVVDNASRDDSAELLQKRQERPVLILNKMNMGYARATNQGLGKAAGDHILLLNPDTVVQPDAFARMLSFMESNPMVGALGPQLLNSDGTIQPSCREFPRPIHLFYDFSGLSRIFPRHSKFGSWRMGYFDHQSLREVDQPMGACLLIRRTALQQIGPMDDERFPMFLNEVDWCYRLKQKAWKIMFFPEARVIHLQGVSIKKDRLTMTVTSHRSLAAYFEKHSPGSLSTGLVKLSLLFALPLRLMHQYFFKKQNCSE